MLLLKLADVEGVWLPGNVSEEGDRVVGGRVKFTTWSDFRLVLDFGAKGEGSGRRPQRRSEICPGFVLPALNFGGNSIQQY